MNKLKKIKISTEILGKVKFKKIKISAEILGKVR